MASLESAFLALTADDHDVLEHGRGAPMSTHAAGLRPARPLLLTYVRLDLARQLRDTFGMFFTVALPAFMFLVFGLGSDDPVGSGNVSMYVMVSMAAYGAVTATTSIAGSAYIEQIMGWGRQLSLTPARPRQLVALKTADRHGGRGRARGGDLRDRRGHRRARERLRLDRLGGGRSGSGRRCSRSTASPSARTSAARTPRGSPPGLIVVMAFLGNVFTPMSGLILDIGRFTPLYGYAGLARYPLTSGHLPMDAGRDSVWLLLANVVAWTVIFALLALLGVRRGRERV